MLERNTKYTTAVQAFLAQNSHATNAEILSHLKNIYPEVSATTVHRITTRMRERNEIAEAPVSYGNAARFDSNLQPHDHFQCLTCDRLRDITLPASVIESLQEIMGDCKLTGHLTIQGTCAQCCNKENL